MCVCVCVCRLGRVKRILTVLKYRLPKMVPMLTFLELLLLLFLVAHWSGALFFYLAYGLGDPDGDEYEQLMFSRGWVFRDGMRDEARKFSNVSALVYMSYKAALY